MINIRELIQFTPFIIIILRMSIILGRHFFLILPRLFILSISFSLLLRRQGFVWIALVIIIIYIGGMMILFTYFLSLRESRPLFLKYSLIVLPLFVTSWDFTSHINIRAIPTNMFNIFLSFIFVFSVSWLFIAIIVVVKITLFNEGPLRIYGY